MENARTMHVSLMMRVQDLGFAFVERLFFDFQAFFLGGGIETKRTCEFSLLQPSRRPLASRLCKWNPTLVGCFKKVDVKSDDHRALGGHCAYSLLRTRCSRCTESKSDKW